MSKPLHTEVHSPHILSLNDRVGLSALGKDPKDYVGINFAMSAMGFTDVGSHFIMIVQIPFGKGIFPDLSRPSILGPQGQQQVPKTFDHALGLPPFLRMLVKPTALDRPIRRAVEDLIAMEGESLDDPDIRARWERANNPQRDNAPRFNIPKEGDPILGSSLAAATLTGEDAKIASVDDIEASLNRALGEDGPTDAGDA